jgi:pyruvate kinase
MLKNWKNANLISKIESIKGVLNLDEILPVVDQILIDRGDLSREVAIEKIPFIQRGIISYVRSKIHTCICSN